MSEIKFDASFASSIRTKLSSVESTVEKAKNRARGAHSVLWADESLTNAFSKSLISDINSAVSKLKKQQELMSQYSMVMKAVEQDLSAVDHDSAKTTIKRIFGWTWLVSGATFVVGFPAAIGGLLWNQYHSSASVSGSGNDSTRKMADGIDGVASETADKTKEAAHSAAAAIEVRNSIMEKYNSDPLYASWGVTKDELGGVIDASSSPEEAADKLDALLKERLDALIEDGHTMDVSNYSEQTYYDYYDPDGIYRENWGLYEKTGGCTWYAFNRYREMNGSDLVFNGAGGGNAQDWNDRINTDVFTTINTDSRNLDNIRNAIAVDDQGSAIDGVYYGHVSYIEAVIDGQVYYSEGWYSNGAFHSRLTKKSIDDFCQVYETVIVSK